MRRTSRRTRPVTKQNPTAPPPALPCGPSIEERLDRIKRIVSVTVAALEGINSDTDDMLTYNHHEIAGHCAQTLTEAQDDLFWLMQLDAKVLNLRAPSAEDRHDAERAGGAL